MSAILAKQVDSLKQTHEWDTLRWHSADITRTKEGIGFYASAFMFM